MSNDETVAAPAELLENAVDTAAQEKARAEFEARLEVAKRADASTFLSLSQVVPVSKYTYRRDYRWYVTEEHPAVKYQGIVRIGMIHLAGQALINALAPALVFSIEDIQKAFNNVSIAEVDGASSEQEDLLVRTAMALTDLAWEASLRMRSLLHDHLNAVVREKATALRIPATKDGEAFTGVELLFEPSAGRFQQFAGIVLNYGDVAGKNTYALIESDLRGQDDFQLAGATFLQELITTRNAETDKAIVADIQNILAALVAQVGDEVLKKDTLPSDAANDGAEPISTDPDITV